MKVHSLPFKIKIIENKIIIIKKIFKFNDFLSFAIKVKYKFLDTINKKYMFKAKRKIIFK
jgi:hypothetical protein